MVRESKKSNAGTRATARSRTTRSAISSEERHRMIAEAAYFKALERDPHNPDPMGDWVAAEAEIDANLLKGSGGPQNGAPRTARKPGTRGPRKEPAS